MGCLPPWLPVHGENLEARIVSFEKAPKAGQVMSVPWRGPAQELKQRPYPTS